MTTLPILFASLTTLIFAGELYAESADAIMDQVAKKPHPKTQISESRMVIEKKGEKVEKLFEALSKSEVISSESPDQKEVYQKITFKKPTKMTYLTYAHPEKDDKVYLITSRGLKKRISVRDRHKSFVGSHLTYGDLAPRKRSDYTYKKLADTTVSGEPAFAIEYTPKSGVDVDYDRAIALIDKTHYRVLSYQTFKGSKIAKTFLLSQFKKIGSYDIPFKTVVTTPSEGQTIVEVLNIKLDQTIPDAKLRADAH